MIPIRSEQGPLVTIAETTEDEAFVSRENLLQTMAGFGYPDDSTRALWNGFENTCGVEFRPDEVKPAYVYAGGMACVRMMMDGSPYDGTDRWLVSVDGLVDGLSSKELTGKYSEGKFRVTKEKPYWEGMRPMLLPSPFIANRLAMIALIGNTFTDDRLEEIDRAATALAVPRSWIVSNKAGNTKVKVQR